MDFKERAAFLERAANIFKDTGKWPPESEWMSNAEMIELFQYFVDTDTMPTGVDYAIMLSVMVANGQVVLRQQVEKFYCFDWASKGRAK